MKLKTKLILFLLKQAKVARFAGPDIDSEIPPVSFIYGQVFFDVIKLNLGCAAYFDDRQIRPSWSMTFDYITLMLCVYLTTIEGSDPLPEWLLQNMEVYAKSLGRFVTSGDVVDWRDDPINRDYKKIFDRSFPFNDFLYFVAVQDGTLFTRLGLNRTTRIAPVLIARPLS